MHLRVEADGRLTFARPNGSRLEAVPAPSSEIAGLDTLVGDVQASGAVWDGTPFDVRWAIDVMYRPPARQAS